MMEHYTNKVMVERCSNRKMAEQCCNKKMTEHCSNQKMTEHCSNDERLSIVAIKTCMSIVTKIFEFNIAKMAHKITK
jgi:hypothetical protein